MDLDLLSNKDTSSPKRRKLEIASSNTIEIPDSPRIEDTITPTETQPLPTHLLQLQAVLGNDVPRVMLEKLWKHSRGDIGLAVNAFFDGSVGAEENEGVKETKKTNSPNKNREARTINPVASNVRPQKPGMRIINAVNDRDAFHVGTFPVAGYATTKGSNIIAAGEMVNIERDRQRPVKKRGFGGPATSASLGSRHRNVIVRFTSTRGFEIGRLPADVARFVSVLIDNCICKFKGTVIYAPPSLHTGEDILLQLHAEFEKEAFAKSKIASANTPSSSSSSSSSLLASQDSAEMQSKEIRLALLSLLKRCGKRPTLSGAAAAKVFGEDVEKTMTGLDAAFADAATVRGLDGGEKAKTEPSEEEKEVSEGELALLYTRAQKLDTKIPEMEPPPEFQLKLRPYQKQALSWMYTKETESWGNDEKGTEETGDDALSRSREALIHPLWEEYAFSTDEGSHGAEKTVSAQGKLNWYFNPYSGEISRAFPRAQDRARGGILADEMGLGKTIEVLSLIAANQRQSTASECRTTLVVCPMSLLAQWRDEAATACPNLTCDVYYGGNRDFKCRFENIDIVITSYGTMMSEFATWEAAGIPKTRAPPLYAVEFHRIVLDEAHQIKSRITRTAKACYAVEARRRWCVTGTPIQNKLEDLYSLIHFLRMEPWSNFSFWRAHITIPFEQSKDVRALHTVQTVLEPIVLMRTKSMKDADGNSIVELPPKNINVEYLDFSVQERDIYDSLFRESKTKFNTYCAAGKVLNNFASIFQLLMRLRQVCDHPILAIGQKQSNAPQHPDGPVNINDLISRFSGGIESEKTAKENVELGQGSGSVAFAHSVFERLLEESADDMGAQTKECAICFEPTLSPVLMPCLHFTCRDCVVGYLQKRDEEGKSGECPICRHPLTEGDLIDVVRKAPAKAKEGKEAGESENVKSDAMLSFDLRRNTFRSSAKLEALISHLLKIRTARPGTRSVVFSQFTSMLDLVEIVLSRHDISFGRLDGSMSQKQREDVLANFKRTKSESSDNGDGVEVLLVSLRAERLVHLFIGGVGLNLTIASEVFMMDPWWNFEIERQAIDRVHRIGQVNPVTIRRFIVRDTVEEKMLTIQERKSALAGGALGMNREEARERRIEDLMILFK